MVNGVNNMLEKVIIKKLTKYLREEGWLCWKTHGSPYTPVGIPDLCALKDGIFIAIELKIPKKKPTPVQLAWIADINDHGHYAFWADNLPAIKYLIDGICQNSPTR